MKIVLTNDDGIHAQGLMELYNVFCSDHEVFVFAPDREQSACSNAITIRNSLDVIVHQEKPHWYSVSGFPADCVSVALHGDITGPVDCVVSGINHGINAGDDIYFSGTVAGARTAYIFGTSALAVSLDSFHRPSEYFRDAAEHVNQFLTRAFSFHKDELFFYNINYPNCSANKYTGSHYTHLGQRKYIDTYDVTHLSEGHRQMNLQGTAVTVDDPDSDITVVSNGGVSITPLMTDTTDYTMLERLRDDN